MGTKERRKAHRSVPSQRHHSGDATRNIERATERERETREKREREKEREKERGGVLVCGGVDFHTVRMSSSKNHWSVSPCPGSQPWGSRSRANARPPGQTCSVRLYGLKLSLSKVGELRCEQVCPVSQGRGDAPGHG